MEKFKDNLTVALFGLYCGILTAAKLHGTIDISWLWVILPWMIIPIEFIIRLCILLCEVIMDALSFVDKRGC